MLFNSQQYVSWSAHPELIRVQRKQTSEVNQTANPIHDYLFCLFCLFLFFVQFLYCLHSSLHSASRKKLIFSIQKKGRLKIHMHLRDSFLHQESLMIPVTLGPFWSCKGCHSLYTIAWYLKASCLPLDISPSLFDLFSFISFTVTCGPKEFILFLPILNLSHLSSVFLEICWIFFLVFFFFGQQ